MYSTRAARVVARVSPWVIVGTGGAHCSDHDRERLVHEVVLATTCSTAPNLPDTYSTTPSPATESSGHMQDSCPNVKCHLARAMTSSCMGICTCRRWELSLRACPLWMHAHEPYYRISTCTSKLDSFIFNPICIRDIRNGKTVVRLWPQSCHGYP